jgi:hypothetical protein
MSLIKETSQQYYAGSQVIKVESADPTTIGPYTFDEELKIYSIDSVDSQDTYYSLNNFILEYSLDGYDPYTVVGAATKKYYIDKNTIVISSGSWAAGHYRVRLKDSNLGSYTGIKLKDVVNNFIVGYVGAGKLIPSVRTSDVLFHAKRGLQEFSYDTLKSIKQQELSIPNSLSVALPQDYVNYVKISTVDDLGVKHIIYPTRKTSNPTESPIQEDNGLPMQDFVGENIEGTSVAETRLFEATRAPVLNVFTINERLGKISFSSDLVDEIIILEYITDGLGADADMRVPKMAEDALYAHIAYSILASRSNVPEYIVRRFKQDRGAKLRNAKIRLSNTKIEEIARVMRTRTKIL